MNENQWDKHLKIQTIGRRDAHADEYHYPYEPTPYIVLERIINSGYITSNSKVIDYGCGKGRVGFFLNHQLGCQVTGIEYNEQIYNQAVDNLKTFTGGLNKLVEVTSGTVKSQKLEFICENAETFQIKDADSFYFFNPFSVEILQSVMGQIVRSYYENPREMQLFFYYPNDEYLAYLMTQENLMFSDEIDCKNLFEGDNARERILIFEVI